VFKNVHQAPAAATRDRRLFRDDRIALSMSSCGKSFFIDCKAVFYSAMFAYRLISDSVPASRSTQIQWIKDCV